MSSAEGWPIFAYAHTRLDTDEGGSSGTCPTQQHTSTIAILWGLDWCKDDESRAGGVEYEAVQGAGGSNGREE